MLGLVSGGKYVISAPSSYAYDDGYAVEVDLELISFEKFKQNFEIDKVGDAIAAQVAPAEIRNAIAPDEGCARRDLRCDCSR